MIMELEYTTTGRQYPILQNKAGGLVCRTCRTTESEESKKLRGRSDILAEYFGN